jgi:hypothetical protein
LVVKLTPKEIEILQLKRKGLKNKQIAEIKEVTEADISQTLSRITKKINSIQDVFGVLQNIGILENAAEIELTESGRTLLGDLRATRPSRLNKMQRPKAIDTFGLDVITLLEEKKYLKSVKDHLSVRALFRDFRELTVNVEGSSLMFPKTNIVYTPYRKSEEDRRQLKKVYVYIR